MSELAVSIDPEFMESVRERIVAAMESLGHLAKELEARRCGEMPCGSRGAEQVETRKVYRVVMNFFDGDHDHGCYQSPFFARREDVEAFLRALVETKDESKQWWTDVGAMNATAETEAVIEEITVQESWNGDLKEASEYRTVTWS